MAEEQAAVPPHKWRNILKHELLEYASNFVFLSFFLVSFAWYRRLILSSYNISYTGWFGPLIEAAILAKVIMIGDALHLGRRFRQGPLIVPTVYRTVVFAILVILFMFAEHIVGAWFHGKTAADGIAEVTSKGWYVILAWFVMVLAAFLPFFTVKEIELAFGQETVRTLFLGRRKHGAMPEAPRE